MGALQQCGKHCFAFNYILFLPLHLMKKWFAFILLVIVAAAVFVPCCTTDNCQADQEMTSKTQNHPLKSSGTCSPFTSCASCTGFVVINKIVQVAALPVALVEHHEHNNSFTPSSYTRSFLQPPKFSI